MNENEQKNSNLKFAAISTIIILSIALITAIIFLIVQVNTNSTLQKEAQACENNSKELEAKVENLENQITELVESSNMQNSGVIDYSKYDATKIIDSDTNNGFIGDHVRGKKDSKVVVVEYADMSCPGCANMMPRMEKIYEEYKDKVAFVYRHYPLKDHVNARPAAAAVESAAMQGYFWEMLSATFENRADWLLENDPARTNAFVNIFKKVAPNGDMQKFRDNLSNSKIEKKINFDYNLGKVKSSVNATPSVYINGQLVDFTKEDATFDSIVEDIKTMIDKELAK